MFPPRFTIRALMLAVAVEGALLGLVRLSPLLGALLLFVPSVYLAIEVTGRLGARLLPIPEGVLWLLLIAVLVLVVAFLGFLYHP